MPYTVKEEAVTARKGVEYNGMAHSFAGMSVQFILFMGIDAGMIVLMQRRSGMWKRLQAAPISRFTVIGSRAASAAIIAMIIMAVVFGFARVVFGVKIEGSFAGFVGVCVAFAIMTATFGLLIAVLGKTPEGDARHLDSGDAAAGDARGKLGADVHLPAVAAEGDGLRADAMGGGRVGRDDLARAGIRGGAAGRSARCWGLPCCSGRWRCGGSGGRANPRCARSVGAVTSRIARRFLS